MREAQLVRAQDARADQLVAHLQRALQRQLRERRGLSQLRMLAERDEGARERRALGYRRHARIHRRCDRVRRERPDLGCSDGAGPGARELACQRAHEPGIAACGLERRIDELGVRRRAERALQDRLDPGRSERRECKPPDRALGRKPRERGPQLVGARAGRHREHERQLLEAQAEHRQHVERRLVEQVRVVGREQHRTALVAERPDDGYEPELARLDGLRRPR